MEARQKRERKAEQRRGAGLTEAVRGEPDLSIKSFIIVTPESVSSDCVSLWFEYMTLKAILF